jgi:hypothetical protein
VQSPEFKPQYITHHTYTHKTSTAKKRERKKRELSVAVYTYNTNKVGGRWEDHSRRPASSKKCESLSAK